MLKMMRHKNVYTIVLWFLIATFVLWGAGSVGRGGPAYVGTIDNKKVSFEDFQKAVTGVRAQIILNYFDNQKILEAFLKNRAALGIQAWYRLIMQSEAKKSGIMVSDAEVIAYITKTNPIFSRGGAFDEQVYTYILRNNMGLEPRSFEEIVRQNLAIQRLKDLLTKDVTITDQEVLESYKKDNQRFKVAYLSFNAADFTDKAAVTEAEAKEYYEKHKSELVVPVKDDAGAETMRAASFEDAKGDIIQYLSEAAGRKKAERYAVEQREKIAALMAKGTTFADAAAELGLQAPVETVFFSKTDYIDGIGEGERLAAAAAKLAKDDLSGAVGTRKGAVVFRVVDIQSFDGEKFGKEKDDYTKRALEEKKMAFLEGWLRDREKKTTLKINLDEYQKYYR